MNKKVISIFALFLITIIPIFLNANEELTTAIEKGETEKVISMLEANPALLTQGIGEGNMRVLHWAVYFGNPTLVDYILGKGMDINIRDDRGLPPVWFAVSGGRPEMLKKLIALNADLSARNSQGEDMLWRSLRGKSIEVVKVLLDSGFKPDAKNAYNQEPVMAAVWNNSLEALKLLESRGAAIKNSGSGGMTLLHHSALGGKADLINYLINKGMDVNARSDRNETPLFLAVNFGNIEGAGVLIANEADINIRDINGISPFMLAIKSGEKDLVGLCLKNKADADSLDKRTGKTALMEAAARGYSQIVEMILKNGADKNAVDLNGFNALSYALKYGNRTTAELLRKNNVKEIPWENNLDNKEYLNKPLHEGKAYIWYLKHSGWAIKTKSAILIFDYWDDKKNPDEISLANGHINPEELKDYQVYVFSTHEHPDHFDKQILESRKTIPNITYIFGFEADPSIGAIYTAPRSQQNIDNIIITTIKSNDAGVGFAVQLDGLTIFHAGDHSNNKIEMENNDFFPEIDFLAEKGINPDIAFFLNMFGCGSTNPEAFQKGIFYAVDKLKIKSVLPMHGANKEWVYGELADGVKKNNIKVEVGAAVNRGDRFFFSDGSLKH